MEQKPLNQNKQSENKNNINIPPIPTIPPVPPVSSSSSIVPPARPAHVISPMQPKSSIQPLPVQSPVKQPPIQPMQPSAQSSMRSGLENARLELENAPAQEAASKSPVGAGMQGNGQQFKLASTEVQGPKPPLVAGGGSKFAMIAVALVLVAVLSIGGYYFFIKDSASDLEAPLLLVSPKITPIIDKNLDSDKDGLPDAIEKILGTYITKADTDGDGFNDLQEIKNGYSPLVAGAAGKLSQEEWDLIKGKIKTEDRDFYEREFGVSVMPTPILSPSPVLTPAPTPTPI